jgi:hypothetical protein
MSNESVHFYDIKNNTVLTGEAVEEELKLRYETCIEVSQQLLSFLDHVRVKGKRQKWSSFKAAILSVLLGYE